MSRIMTEDAKNQLTRDVKTILRLAKRKMGVTGEQICSALKMKEDFTSYRYRRTLTEAKGNGLVREGEGIHAVWRVPAKRRRRSS